jgi:hypothetical protein
MKNSRQIQDLDRHFNCNSIDLSTIEDSQTTFRDVRSLLQSMFDGSKNIH